MITLLLRSGLASLLLVAMTVGELTVGEAAAQCNTCAAPTVAYSPVVAQPVVAQPTVAYRPYTGWYPGKLLDQWRLRRAGVRPAAPAYTATYAPTYSAAYAPTYTAAYAPTSYTASYTPTYTAARPYVTSFAPLSVPATTYTQTVARPVLMRPVVAPACNACSYTPDCGCNTCATSVSQAVYSEPSGCSTCAGGGSVTTVVPQNNSAPSVGPPTSQPTLAPIPQNQSNYQSDRPIQGSGSRDVTPPAGEAEPDPLDTYDPLNGDDPGPAEAESDSSTWYNAPRLLDPRDRTALRTYKSRQPTVDVNTAIYRNDNSRQRVNHTTARRTAPRAPTQAEIDAEGWSSVPSGR